MVPLDSARAGHGDAAVHRRSGVVGLDAYDGLRTAKVELQTGGDQLVAGSLDGRGSVPAAADAGDAAAGAFRHPALRLLSIMPWIGDDVGAGRDLSEAAAEAGHGGVLLVDAARTAGWDGQRVPGFGTGGQIDPAVIERAAPAIAQASQLLTGRGASGVDRLRRPPPAGRRRGHPGARGVDPARAPGATRGVGDGTAPRVPGRRRAAHLPVGDAPTVGPARCGRLSRDVRVGQRWTAIGSGCRTSNRRGASRWWTRSTRRPRCDAGTTTVARASRSGTRPTPPTSRPTHA